jgi:glutathione peroxidase-family protein
MLVTREGRVVKRFKPSFDPTGLEGDVRLLLVRWSRSSLMCSI